RQTYDGLIQAASERGEVVIPVSEPETREIARVVGIGAVKYADLSQNRTSDYRFVPEKMTALEGNTSAYLQYAYVRNRSIFRIVEVDIEALRRNPPPVELGTAQERQLAVALLRYPEALSAVALDYRPNLLTAYLYDLAGVYSTFFRHCRVLQ